MSRKFRSKIGIFEDPAEGGVKKPKGKSNLMRSFIIASPNQEKGLEKALLLSSQNKIDKLDITIEDFEKAVGIADVRAIQKALFFKPLKGIFKSLVISARNGLTIESQNALLKILEEPPRSSFIFLIVENESVLLPTILSRCKVIKIKGDETVENELSQFRDLIERLLSEKEGFRLKLAEKYGGSREESLVFIKNSIITAREVMIRKINNDEGNLENFKKLIVNLEKGHYALKNTNVAPRFILENTLLSI